MRYTYKYCHPFFLVALVILVSSCQKLNRPSLGDYPKDANPPGGPLKFYAAFDGTTTNPLMNAVDSIRAAFPSNNPLTSIGGIEGQAVQGDGTTYIKYAAANDFSSHDSSFTIAFWEKRDGIPNGNAAFLFTLPSANKQWGSYGFSMFLLFDWGTWSPATKAKVKFYMVDDNCKCDNWFTWDSTKYTNGPQPVQTDFVANVQDNNWHHIAFVYDATSSSLTLYVDGVANPNVLIWGTHGNLITDPSKIQGLDIGGNENIPNLGWGQHWDGGLDQFRFYGEALSASDVQALYNNKQ
ncbi:MAG: LamG domain-containing protein [Bacteroidetes bacterium]|nr:LamG domain-containing protein [Bacteroidota bacterium]MBS1935130.1 LamG domain-containing protein [Bacteroidota bacterium]